MVHAAHLPSHLDATSWGSSGAAVAEKCSCLMIVSALGLGQLPLCSLSKACCSTGFAPLCPVCCGTLSSPGISVLRADGGASPAVAWLSIQHMLFPAVQAVLAAVIRSSLIAVQHREAALWLNCVPLWVQEDCGGKPKSCVLSKPYTVHCRGACAVAKPSACREWTASLCCVHTLLLTAVYSHQL